MSDIKYLNNINLTNNQLLNTRLENAETNPVSASLGQVYFNTVAKEVRIFDGDE